MTVTHGQLDERAERIKKTSAWLGAAPMTDFGERFIEDTGEHAVSPQIVQTTAQQIRVALQSGHATVRCGERHRPTAVAVAELLTSAERRFVIFDLDNVLPPEVVDMNETASCADRSGRDIIRPKQPNVIRVEDGSLRPS